MTNEKIFANEILSDEQLDNVNGGGSRIRLVGFQNPFKRISEVYHTIIKLFRKNSDKIIPSNPQPKKVENTPNDTEKNIPEVA